MSENFDAYHVWLGIPPAEQPAHHYRLLGLQLFESNPDVIDHAADRQMAHLRSLQAGRHSQESQQLLNEVSAARCCLLDPAQKERYDDDLRKLQCPVSPPVELPIKESLATPAAPSKQKNFSLETAKIIGGGILGIALAFLMLKVLAGVDVSEYLRRPAPIAKNLRSPPPKDSKSGISEAPPATTQAPVPPPVTATDSPSVPVEQDSPEKPVLKNALPQADLVDQEPLPAANEQSAIPKHSPDPKTTPGVPSERIQQPDTIIPPAKVEKAAQLEMTELVGNSGRGTQYRAVAPNDAVLVGFAITFGKFGRTYSNSSIGSLQPIYALGNKKELGPVLGTPGHAGFQVAAKPGFAVAGVRVNADTRVLGLQITFAPLKDGKLVLSSAYDSKWIGIPLKDAPAVATGDGPAIGVTGWWAKESIRSLGLVYRPDVPPLDGANDNAK